MTIVPDRAIRTAARQTGSDPVFAPRVSDNYAQIESPLGAIGFDPSVGYYRPYYPPRPAKVSITMVLDELYNINELDFSFNIGFTLILSWEVHTTSYVFTLCAHALTHEHWPHAGR